MNNRKTPRIRFKRFTDDWEQRKLGKIAQREDTLRASSSEYPCVEYEDVISEEGRLNKNIRSKETKKFGIQFSTTQVLFGKLRPYLHNWLNPDFKGVAVGDWWVLRPVGVDKNFLFRLIQTRRFDEVANQSSGSKMPRADWNLVSNTEFAIPCSLKEQAQISEVFDNLDHLITLHQRKLEKLKIVKKAMLENCFPKNGEKVPKFRFSGFTGDWEQRKLGDYIIEYHEVTHENNQYPVLTSSRKGIFLQTEYFSGNQIASEDNTGYNIVPYGYFTYRHMSDDEIFHFNINDIVENGIVSTLYPVFTTTEELHSRYLQYQLNHGHEFARFAVLQKQGGSRTYMYLRRLKQLSLTISESIDEQRKISDFLMNLDHLITLHQRKLEKLKIIKKSFLEKMFV